MLKLLFVSSLFFCSRSNYITVNTLVGCFHRVVVFQTGVPSFFTEPLLCARAHTHTHTHTLSLSLFSLLYLFFSLSAVHSSLFLGLVVRWPSTHEQLDFWPWCDLSPLLQNHTHRWDVCFLFSFSLGKIKSFRRVSVLWCICVCSQLIASTTKTRVQVTSVWVLRC